MKSTTKLITKSDFFRAIMDDIIIDVGVYVEHMAEYRHYTGKLFRKASWVKIRSIAGFPANGVPSIEVTFGVWNGGLTHSGIVPVECRVQVAKALSEIISYTIVDWPEDGPIVDLRQAMWDEVVRISSVPGVENMDLYSFLDITPGWMLTFSKQTVELHIDDVKDNDLNGRIRYDENTGEVLVD